MINYTANMLPSRRLRLDIVMSVKSLLDRLWGFTSRFFCLFSQFTEGCSKSRVSRLGSWASIGYDGAVER